VGSQNCTWRLWLLVTSIQNAPFISGSVKEEILDVLRSSTDTRVAAGTRVRFMSRLNGKMMVEMLDLRKLLMVGIDVRDTSA
jgi:hypothetical protein